MLKHSKQFDGVHFERRKKDEINDDLSGKMFLKSSPEISPKISPESSPESSDSSKERRKRHLLSQKWVASQTKSGGKHSSITWCFTTFSGLKVCACRSFLELDQELIMTIYRWLTWVMMMEIKRKELEEWWFQSGSANRWVFLHRDGWRVHVIFFPLKGLQISSWSNQISSQEDETPDQFSRRWDTSCDWMQVTRL